jgi:hypothetical protein
LVIRIHGEAQPRRRALTDVDLQQVPVTVSSFQSGMFDLRRGRNNRCLLIVQSGLRLNAQGSASG